MPATLERNLEELICDAYNDDPTRVRRVARQMPPDQEMEESSLLLKALADPVRARILCALNIEPLCVCELSTLLGISMPSVSHHLKILTRVGMLQPRKEGKFVSYHLGDTSHVRTLMGLFRAVAASEGART